MKRVLIIQNDWKDTPGTLGEVLNELGIDVEILHVYRGDEVPGTLEGFSGLVVLGGPMGVGDQAQFPFLTEEIVLLEHAIESSFPTLGICLGAQLLAAAANGNVRRNDVMEIGWFDVKLSADAQIDPLFQGLDNHLTLFEWHGDTFDLPESVTLLASTATCTNQAFRVSSNAYGLQFHIEADKEMIDTLVETNDDELSDAKVDGARVLLESKTNHPQMKELARTIFTRWTDLLT